jgi:hypothetical protein
MADVAMRLCEVQDLPPPRALLYYHEALKRKARLRTRFSRDGSYLEMTRARRTQRR